MEQLVNRLAVPAYDTELLENHSKRNQLCKVYKQLTPSEIFQQSVF